MGSRFEDKTGFSVACGAMSAPMHSNAQILDRRTLQNDHRHLASILRQGQSVLYVGCGTGAITVGIARAVGREGFVLGIDRDSLHLDSARKNHPFSEPSV